MTEQTKAAAVLRLKMQVTQVSDVKAADGKVVRQQIALNAVHGPGNEQWSQATPSGTLVITIDKPESFDSLGKGAGRDFYVDFFAVPKDEPKTAPTAPVTPAPRPT